MTEEKPVSLRQIAQIAGVSVATVSRVIHNNGRFSKETEARVREVIERYHYSPDITAQSMRTKRVPRPWASSIPIWSVSIWRRSSFSWQERLFDLGICHVHPRHAGQRRARGQPTSSSCASIRSAA